MRNGVRVMSYGVRVIVGWFAWQLVLTFCSVPREELFRRLFVVGFGIGVLLAVRARIVGM